jgi:hypothetical protein
MVLVVHSNTSYLYGSKAHSRMGRHMIMAGRDNIPTNNVAVLNILQITRAVTSSAAEVELGVLFINAKTAISMCHMLEELGHPQPPTPTQSDNKTANDLFTSNKIMPEALKAMDMHFHWLQCCNAHRQFKYHWRPSTHNLADYFTKHHPASHRKASRPTFLTPRNDPQYTKLFLTSPDMKPNVKISTKSLTTTNSFAKKILTTERFWPVPEQMSITAQSA